MHRLPPTTGTSVHYSRTTLGRHDRGPDRTPLARDFFDRPVLEVAPDLLGRILVRPTPDGPIELRLTEVEAYAGRPTPAPTPTAAAPRATP